MRVSALALALWLLSLSAPGVAELCPPAVPETAAPPIDAGAFPASIQGVLGFARERGIHSLSELLTFLPHDMRRNYAFMEDTGTPNEASVEHPRQIVFTSDSAFSMAFNTHPDFGAWEQADLMELGQDGHWRFAALVFEGGRAALGDDSSCASCHAATPQVPPEPDAPLVPRWGPYPVWPGAFGDDGQRHSAGLTADQARAVLAWQQGAPERIDQLVHYGARYRPRLPLFLPAKPATTALNHINIDLAPRHALSVVRRFRGDPDYAAHRSLYLAASHCGQHSRWAASGARGRVAQAAAALGVSPSWQGFWMAFGIPHPEYELDLAALPGEPTRGWGDGFDGVRQYVDVLVLKELVDEDERLDAALRSVPDEPTLFSEGCFENKRQALDWVVLYNFSERARHQVLRERWLESLRAWRGLIYESSEALCPVLFDRLAGGGRIAVRTGEAGPATASR